MREQIMQAVYREKMIVIVRGVDSKQMIPLAEAMYQGGIRLLEVTYSANGAVSDEETADNICRLSKHFEGKMFIGAGTVIRPNQVELTRKAGGGFVISPDTDPEIIRKTRELGMVSMPGALTPSEIRLAVKEGADFVKLFPVDSMGPAYVKAVRAPLSHIPLLAVGGVNLNNIKDYLQAGVCGFGISSNIIDKTLLAKEDYEGITKLAKQYTEAVKGECV